MSWELLSKTLRVIMQFAPDEINLHKVHRDVEQIKYVKSLHHVHIWQLSDKEIYFEGHIEFDKNLLLDEVGETITEVATLLKQKFHIFHVTLQPEIGKQDSKGFIVQD